jgi:uncharacterized membrane protein
LATLADVMSQIEVVQLMMAMAAVAVYRIKNGKVPMFINKHLLTIQNNKSNVVVVSEKTCVCECLCVCVADKRNFSAALERNRKDVKRLLNFFLLVLVLLSFLLQSSIFIRVLYVSCQHSYHVALFFFFVLSFLLHQQTTIKNNSTFIFCHLPLLFEILNVM